jgi:hypothetical protein
MCKSDAADRDGWREPSADRKRRLLHGKRLAVESDRGATF